jgi:hypothetical protein
MLRLLAISSVTILTFFQMVSIPAFRSHSRLIDSDAQYEKHKLYSFLAFIRKNVGGKLPRMVKT